MENYSFEAALKFSENEKVRRVLLGPPVNFNRLQEIIAKLNKFREELGFDEFFIFNSIGTIVAHSIEIAIGLNYIDRKYVQNTINGEGVQAAVVNAITGLPEVVTTFPVLWGPTKKVIGGVALSKTLQN
jgi:hypothetical protein